ncbi:MAG: glycosyltransferase family 2 protein [Parcubacteria group bacterium]
MPKIFIIILNYNGKDCLGNTLADVFRLEYANFEIVLVDNASQDGSLEEVLNKFSKAIVIRNSQNVGFAAGMNVGIKYALERGAEYVLLLNYDVSVPQNCLSLLVEDMEKDRKIGVGSPLIFEKSGAVWFSGGRINWWRMRADQLTEKLQENYFLSDYISGCAMLIRASVFHSAGLLDERYFLYYEDTDFSFAARTAGYKLLVSAKSQIMHLEKSRESGSQKVYWLVLSALIFFKKNTPLYLKPYTSVFLGVRRFKNWLEVRFYKNDMAGVVQKAYQDFYDAK